ncbi:acetyl-CoA synthetase-like protein [Lojkania enalia]|uniref:Acetyl-CoA synthetase-like protein n=1 Tax=Lojkania enalia TaxID=147567 RepID=A0A9P4N1T8_9PLEO|nr:acetyl-CoA synthetase-like protein [Didymosphaeria enalia]
MAVHHRKQLLVNIVDGLAKVKPLGVYAYIPISPDGYDKGWTKLTYQKYANAVNGLAWWLTAQFGKNSSFETLTYVGPNDFRHNALILACQKVGYKLLLASHRNQHEALRALLDQASCKAILTADPASAMTTRYQEAFPLSAFQVPSLDVLLSESFPHYPFRKTFEEAKLDPLVVLHTSGTTGLPKPIIYSNDWVAAYMQSMQVLPPGGKEMKTKHWSGTRFFVIMPPHHAANLFTAFFIPFANETTIIFPPANLPPTMDVFIKGIKSIQVDSAFIPPSLISQLALDEDLLEIAARHLDVVYTGGGKSVEAHGDIVSSRLNYQITYGATETGNIPDILTDAPNSWNYIQPHSAAGWEFRLHEQTESQSVYEAWIVRSKDSEMEQPVFKLFPHLREYSTRDLYSAHPTEPGLWKWVSRIDDTIVLSSGANLSPVIMENGLEQHPSVLSVVMAGCGQLRPVLILERRDPIISAQQLIEEVWSTVEELNQHYYEDHRVLKSHIIVTTQERPMARTMKGTIQRHATVDLYEADLEDLFMKAT